MNDSTGMPVAFPSDEIQPQTGEQVAPLDSEGELLTIAISNEVKEMARRALDIHGDGLTVDFVKSIRFPTFVINFR
jgi:hypothetical protein